MGDFEPGNAQYRMPAVHRRAGARFQAQIREAAQGLGHAALAILFHFRHDFAHFFNFRRVFRRTLQLFEFGFLAGDDFLVIGAHLLFQRRARGFARILPASGDQRFGLVIEFRTFFFDCCRVFVEFCAFRAARMWRAPGIRRIPQSRHACARQNQLHGAVLSFRFRIHSFVPFLVSPRERTVPTAALRPHTAKNAKRGRKSTGFLRRNRGIMEA